jgi:hypothetical protein
VKSDKDRKILWRNVDPSRKIIYRENMPLSVPFSQLSDPSSLDVINLLLDNEEAVLVTLFRDQVEQTLPDALLKNLTGMMERIRMQAIAEVNQKLPNRQIRVLNWPDEFRSGHDNQRSSHPYISFKCRLAIIVSDKKVDKNNDDDFKKTLFSAIYADTKTRSIKKWVILGDETGALEEFKNKNNPKKSAMCWVAIPPGTELPELDPAFHCTGTGAKEFYLEALSNLSNNDSILYYTFNFEDGNINSSNKNPHVRDPHLAFWQDTLPLVLEMVANQTHSKTDVDIFVEQVSSLEPGRDMLSPVVQEFSNLLPRIRKKWHNLKFDEMWIIAKGEHPWIGYPDAVGANLGRRFTELGEDQKNTDKKLYEKLVKTPYRQISLNGAIRQLLKDTARPLVFLKSLADITIEDQRDYVEVFLSEAIKEAIESLNESQWQKLLSHMYETSKTRQGQAATTLIHQRTDITSTLETLQRDADKFNFGLAMLGTSNHIGAETQAELCEKVLNDLIRQGYQPSRERRMKFKNLKKGKADNIFDFSHIEAFEVGGDVGEEEMRFLGAQAQSRALRGSEQDQAEALRIEEFLLDKTVNEDDILRRITLRAELLIDMGGFEEGYVWLTKEVKERLSSSQEELMKDSYYLAALVKSCALTRKDRTELERLGPFIPGLLNEHHPSQRIAYWVLCWIHSINTDAPPHLISEEESKLSVICLDRLHLLTKRPLFSHDAPGVILACELLDLESKGYGIDGKMFYEIIKKNAKQTTHDWLEKHPPNEDDWLAPLNFNYR